MKTDEVQIHQFIQNFNTYKTHLKLLEADKKTTGSLLNLKNNTDTENNEFLQALKNISCLKNHWIIRTCYYTLNHRRDWGECQRLHVISFLSGVHNGWYWICNNIHCDTPSVNNNRKTSDNSLIVLRVVVNLFKDVGTRVVSFSKSNGN